MSERVQVLEGKLPEALLAKIARYDSHVAADLIRSLHFRELPATGVSPPRKLVSATEPTYFCPVARETMFRELNNRTRHQTGHVFLPIFGDTHSWLMSFDTWRFDTVLDLDYLPDWAREQYLYAATRPTNEKNIFE